MQLSRSQGLAYPTNLGKGILTRGRFLVKYVQGLSPVFGFAGSTELNQEEIKG